ncbi:MAG: 1-deoxy-D-xylulose-5-phosphate synthase [SAR324 cluster bacterium]|nr:1-deoxy-D-xylulose-5-phosphate synthase [SAR324 cluster bacterium]
MVKNILNSIINPHDIHHLTPEELIQLAQECRERIIEVTSRTGGHLASSLGSIEITIALFKLFDFRSDRIIWDVGHQAYAHKILTGRNKQFETLTQKGGIKKFLSPKESPYDHFGAGHASTSLSAALGMAVGRDHNQQNHHVIAVIGDGSLTGGLAFEALNHNGYLGKNMIMILSDNGMSIDPNVGALSKLIIRVTSSKPYNRLRDEAWDLAGKIPFSEVIRAGIFRLNASIKTFIMPSMLFEQLGWRYFGPVDGHSIPDLLEILSHVKNLKGPIVIHALTQKGKGYSFAENDSNKYHGVAPFVPESGEFIKKQSVNPKEKSYTQIFGDKLEELMDQDPTVIGISPAMLSGSGMLHLFEKYPDRIFDVGIAEGHCVTFAAGMATTHLKPFAAVYSTFLQRAVDHVLHDVAIQKLPVRFMIDRAGLVGADGPTHQGVFDLTYLRMIPNMTIMVPKDGTELQAMIDFAYHYNDGPSAVRYPRGNTDQFDKPLIPPIQFGKAHVLEDGNDIVLFAVGTMVKTALEVSKILNERGYSVAVINARFVKPLDTEIVCQYGQMAKLLVTLEENSIQGGFGSAVLEKLSEHALCPLTLTLGVPDFFIAQGSPDQQREDSGLSVTLALDAILKKWELLPQNAKKISHPKRKKIAS